LTNVVAFRAPRREPPQRAPALGLFEDAWKAFPEQGRLRSSRREAGPEWAKAAREVGEEALLAAVRRYTAEDKEHKRDCGPPGFHRWLKWGRYEHWLREGPALGARQFADARIRQALVAAAGEPFVGSYLDPCELDGTTLVVRTGVAMTRLQEHSSVLKALGLTGMRKMQAP
jgi:hypothetical protein